MLVLSVLLVCSSAAFLVASRGAGCNSLLPASKLSLLKRARSKSRSGSCAAREARLCRPVLLRTATRRMALFWRNAARAKAAAPTSGQI